MNMFAQARYRELSYIQDTVRSPLKGEKGLMHMRNEPKYYHRVIGAKTFQNFNLNLKTEMKLDINRFGKINKSHL